MKRYIFAAVAVLMLRIPIFLGNLFQQFYNTVDTWVVAPFLAHALSF